jgi:Protein of unknown function (DUF2752)
VPLPAPAMAITKQRVRAMVAPAVVAAAACVGCAVVAWANPTDPENVLPRCPTKLLFGIDCPGCGSMRMVYSLMHGDVGAAVHYNAVALVVLPLLALALATWAIGRWRGREVRSWQHWRWTPAVTLVVFTVWFVIRNLPFEPFRSLKV